MTPRRVLALVAGVGLLVVALWIRGGRSSRPAEDAVAEPPIARAEAAELAAARRPVVVTAVADPFALSRARRRWAALRPRLEAIVRGRERERAAMVSGELVREGQRWHGFRVLAIEARAVRFEGPGGFRVRLGFAGAQSGAASGGGATER